PAPVVIRAPSPDLSELARAAAMVRASSRPMMIAGGGVLYSGATEALRDFAQRHGVPVTETQAGKSALAWDHPLQMGAVGVTGSTASTDVGAETDLLFAVGTRLQDFSTGSRAHFTQARRVHLNVNAFDAAKWSATPLGA